MTALEWDHADATVPWYKTIDLRFRADMAVPDWGWCTAERTDKWGCSHYCDRPHGHTGRHLSAERMHRYPVAVWS